MRLLLDTHVVLWAIADDARLGPESRRLLGDVDCVRFVSAASIWEVEIKSSIGKLKLDEDLRVVIANTGVEPLDITWFHAQTAGRLPQLHRDPFDRLLAAQSRRHDARRVQHHQIAWP